MSTLRVPGVDEPLEVVLKTSELWSCPLSRSGRWWMVWNIRCAYNVFRSWSVFWPELSALWTNVLGLHLSVSYYYTLTCNKPSNGSVLSPTLLWLPPNTPWRMRIFLAIPPNHLGIIFLLSQSLSYPPWTYACRCSIFLEVSKSWTI